MNLSPYHQKQADLSDNEISNRVKAKEQELSHVFAIAKPHFNKEQIKIAILGCGDKRYVKAHQELFTTLLHKKIELITFDISIDHLRDEEGVVEHDCTLPLLNPPYDITYAHVLLKFIDKAHHWDLLKNSYDALENGGMAIHILDTGDFTGDDAPVPLEILKSQLTNDSIRFVEIPVEYGEALVLLK